MTSKYETDKYSWFTLFMIDSLQYSCNQSRAKQKCAQAEFVKLNKYKMSSKKLK